MPGQQSGYGGSLRAAPAPSWSACLLLLALLHARAGGSNQNPSSIGLVRG